MNKKLRTLKDFDTEENKKCKFCRFVGQISSTKMINEVCYNCGNCCRAWTELLEEKK